MPVAVNVTELVPVALAPRARLPLAAVDCRVRAEVDETAPRCGDIAVRGQGQSTAVAARPEVERLPPLLVIVPGPMVPDTASGLPMLVIVVAPASFKAIVLAWVLRLPTEPVAAFTLIVGAMMLPAD